MKYFIDILAKASVYPFEGTPALNKHLEDELSKVTEKWLKEFERYLPPADASDHAKGAHDAIKDLKNWINHKEPIKEA